MKIIAHANTETQIDQDHVGKIYVEITFRAGTTVVAGLPA